MRAIRSWRLLVLLCPLMLVLAACGDDDPAAPGTGADAPTTGDDPGWEQLVEAAQAEGSLVIYGAPVEGVLQATANAFTNEYGISVEFVRMSTGMIEERFSAEASAGEFIPDIILMADVGDGSFFPVAAENGWIESDLATVGMPGFPWGFPTDWIRGMRAVVHIAPWIMAYNTQVIDDPPGDLHDLTDDRFRDQMITTDPSVSPAYDHVWLAALDALGEEWLEAVAAQNIRVSGEGVQDVEMLAAGEGGIAFPVVGSQVQDAIDRGAPLEMVIPSATSGVEIGVAIVDLDRSSHPNAAKLFAAWLLQEDGNRVFGDFPATFDMYEGLSAELPDGYVSPFAVSESDREHYRSILLGDR